MTYKALFWVVVDGLERLSTDMDVTCKDVDEASEAFNSHAASIAQRRGHDVRWSAGHNLTGVVKFKR